MNNPELILINELIQKSLEGEVSDRESQTLNAFVSQQENAAYYVKCLRLHYMLKRRADMPLLQESKQLDSSDSLSFALKELADYEAVAPAVELPPEKPAEKVPVKMLKIEKAPRKIHWPSMATAILTAAAMLLLVALVKLNPVLPEVATLTDSIDAKWVNDKGNPMTGDVFRQGDMFTLSSGFSEITFRDGAKVIVEAPAIFELQSPKSMFLTSGKLSAIVSEYAIGFTVNTPSASIIDLGTEFGAVVKADGTCGLHMFEGKASLIGGSNGQRRSSQIVTKNQARSVDVKTGVIRPIALTDKEFVRRMDSEHDYLWRGQNLSLADMLAGYNGLDFSGQPRMLDAETGTYRDEFVRHNRYGTGEYTVVPSNPFIDGVFIPDGENGGQTVSSEGHVFADCPNTQSYNRFDVTANAKFPLDPASSFQLSNGDEDEMVELAINTNVPSRLMGAFGMDDPVGQVRSNIFMHANSGITFDLQKIRSALPEITPRQFLTLFGIADGARKNGQIDVWVLVDGTLRFNRQDFVYSDGVIDIVVDLADQDRFLTLMVTDSESEGEVLSADRAASQDWGLFANPMLVVESIIENEQPAEL